MSGIISPVSKDESTIDYYHLLGVSSTADASQIKKAYHNKARELHPDRHVKKNVTSHENVDYKALFQQVKEAYQTLMDPDARQQYDSRRNINLGGRAAKMAHLLGSFTYRCENNEGKIDQQNSTTTPSDEVHHRRSRSNANDEDTDDEDYYTPDAYRPLNNNGSCDDQLGCNSFEITIRQYAQHDGHSNSIAVTYRYAAVWFKLERKSLTDSFGLILKSDNSNDGIVLNTGVVAGTTAAMCQFPSYPRPHSLTSPLQCIVTGVNGRHNLEEPHSAEIVSNNEQKRRVHYPGGVKGVARVTAGHLICVFQLWCPVRDVIITLPQMTQTHTFFSYEHAHPDSQSMVRVDKDGFLRICAQQQQQGLPSLNAKDLHLIVNKRVLAIDGVPLATFSCLMSPESHSTLDSINKSIIAALDEISDVNEKQTEEKSTMCGGRNNCFAPTARQMRKPHVTQQSITLTVLL